MQSLNRHLLDPPSLKEDLKRSLRRINLEQNDLSAQFLLHIVAEFIDFDRTVEFNPSLEQLAVNRS